MRKLTIAFLFPLMFFAFALSSLSAQAEKSDLVKPEKSLDLDTPVDCGECHKRIYEEWVGTMHAHSTPAKNPMVKAYYDFLLKENYDTSKCDKCHVPFRALYPEEKDKNAKLFMDGVSCLFCHSVHGKNSGDNQGIDYYKLDFFKPITGPTKTDKSAHDSKFLGLYKHVDICSGCHQSGEAEYYAEGKSKSLCQQCHMPSMRKVKSAKNGPVREKVYQHLFEGGHSPILLSMAAIIEGKAQKKDGKTILHLKLENLSLHRIPIGFPLRAIYVKVTALDENDNPIWSNYKEHPKNEDPKSYFALSYPEEEAVYVHFVKNIKPIKDTRLEAASIKKLSYDVSSDKIAAFQVKLFYRLLPESVQKKLNMDEAVAQETLMSEETITID